MNAWLSSLPQWQDFVPPTPRGYALLSTLWKWAPLSTIVCWTPFRHYQAMGKTSSKDSRLNLPGRYAWAIAESTGPINLCYILYTLPKRLYPQPNAASSLLGTGLPIQHEIMGLLYVIHYANRAVITPLLLAPSMSPLHLYVACGMATFQFVNSSNLAGWIVYSALGDSVDGSSAAPLLSIPSILGLGLYVLGLAGNIIAENTLFELRRGSARRKAKSEGKATITYDKVYVIPPAQGLYKYILFPHYSLEWIEWTGYWILGGALGLGYSYSKSAGLWFLAMELGTMMPRAWEGVQWYTNKFGARAVGGRTGSVPGIV